MAQLSMRQKTLTHMKLYIPLSLVVLCLLTSCNGQTTGAKRDIDNAPQHTRGNLVTVPGNNIMTVYHDSKNLYWFGSWQTGLYRYDGRTLSNYTTAHGLPAMRIEEIKEDHAGNLYFATCYPRSAITRFNGHSFTTLRAAADNDWKLDPDDLWFRHAEPEKVFRYDGATLHELKLPKPPGFSGSFEIYSIYHDKHGNLWFGTNPVGVCRYNGKAFEWITESDVTEFGDRGANGVRSITEDKNGDFWFNTEYRYSIYDSLTVNSKRFYTRYPSLGSLDGKKNGNINEYLSIVTDNENNIWIATYRNGVWKYDGTTVTHYPVLKDSTQIAIFSIYKDNAGTLWLGTHENGAYKFNGVTFGPFTP